MPLFSNKLKTTCSCGAILEIEGAYNLCEYQFELFLHIHEVCLENLHNKKGEIIDDQDK